MARISRSEDQQFAVRRFSGSHPDYSDLVSILRHEMWAAVHEGQEAVRPENFREMLQHLPNYQQCLYSDTIPFAGFSNETVGDLLSTGLLVRSRSIADFLLILANYAAKARRLNRNSSIRAEEKGQTDFLLTPVSPRIDGDFGVVHN